MWQGHSGVVNAIAHTVAMKPIQVKKTKDYS